MPNERLLMMFCLCFRSRVMESRSSHHVHRTYASSVRSSLNHTDLLGLGFLFCEAAVCFGNVHGITACCGVCIKICAWDPCKTHTVTRGTAAAQALSIKLGTGEGQVRGILEYSFVQIYRKSNGLLQIETVFFLTSLPCSLH